MSATCIALLNNCMLCFCRSEFEYLAGLLQSRTVGYNTLQAEVSNIKQTWSREKENGSRGLPVDFSIRSYSVAVSMQFMLNFFS